MSWVLWLFYLDRNIYDFFLHIHLQITQKVTALFVQEKNFNFNKI